MYDAARHAAIHDTIMNFPQKYATVVGERGLKVRSYLLHGKVMCIFLGICKGSIIYSKEWIFCKQFFMKRRQPSAIFFFQWTLEILITEDLSLFFFPS